MKIACSEDVDDFIFMDPQWEHLSLLYDLFQSIVSKYSIIDSFQSNIPFTS